MEELKVIAKKELLDFATEYIWLVWKNTKEGIIHYTEEHLEDDIKRLLDNTIRRKKIG
jgi:hypothetical protein